MGDCLAAVGASAAQPPVARSRSLWWWRRRLRERQRVHAVRGCGPVLVPWLPRPGGRGAADYRHPLGTLLRGTGVRGWGGWLGPASGPNSRVGVPERRSVRCARTLPASPPPPPPPPLPRPTRPGPRSGLALLLRAPAPALPPVGCATPGSVLQRASGHVMGEGRPFALR